MGSLCQGSRGLHQGSLRQRPQQVLKQRRHLQRRASARACRRPCTRTAGARHLSPQQCGGTLTTPQAHTRGCAVRGAKQTSAQARTRAAQLTRACRARPHIHRPRAGAQGLLQLVQIFPQRAQVAFCQRIFQRLQGPCAKRNVCGKVHSSHALQAHNSA